MDSKNQIQNREIKFRAWDNDDKKLIYSGNNYPFHKMGGYYLDDLIGNESELMQYTGLKDKNGKEVYEGDIVKRYTGYVFEEKIRKYSLGNTNEAKVTGYDHHPTDEIIGNIYENPELIK